MKRYGLGDFADQLSIDQVNGALGNVGADYRLGAAPTEGIQTPTAPVAPQAHDSEVPGQEKKKQGGGGLGNVLGLVGQFMGGAYGAALQGAGSLMGGRK